MWYENDKFFLSLNEEDSKLFIDYISDKNNRGPGFVRPSYHGEWFGQIKNCPTCKELRVTSCSACGCGSCFTCKFQWRCTTGFINTIENQYRFAFLTEDVMDASIMHLTKHLGEKFELDISWNELNLVLKECIAKAIRGDTIDWINSKTIEGIN